MQNLKLNLKPKKISLKNIGSNKIGFISILENFDIPFDVNRVYLVHATPNNVTRGFHAHKELQQILIASSGSVKINLIDRYNNNQVIELNSPKEGLYIPPLVWRTIEYSDNAVLVCLASINYDENEYIRDFNEFKKLIQVSII